MENESASYITTFQAHKLATNNLGPDERSTFMKIIAEKCEGRHLVRNTDFVDTFAWLLSRVVL